MESYSVIAADGSGVERDLHSQPLPDNGGPAAGPIWAPDSSAIAYGRMGDPARAGMSASPREFPDHAYLAIQPLAGGPDRVIYGDLLGSMGWPAWSPDGQWLAVTVGSEEFSRAVVMRSDGSDRKTLLPRNAQPGLECGGVGWAPDGQSLLYGCGQVLRYFLDDLDHPEPMPVPSTVGWLGWQRDPGR
jgi:Tol biopolymer transport system component